MSERPQYKTLIKQLQHLVNDIGLTMPVRLIRERVALVRDLCDKILADLGGPKPKG